MDHLAQRQKNPQYLQMVIAQRQIIISQDKRIKQQLQKIIQQSKDKINKLENKINDSDKTYNQEILNLNLATKQLKKQLQSLKHTNNQLEFNLNVLKVKNQQLIQQHQKQTQFLKNQFQVQKQTLINKINKLQNNLNSVKIFYHTDQKIKQDRIQIIQDSNRDMRGFSNQRQSRMIILQNQQLNNQIQFQSKNIINLLEKNQKLQQQIKYYKRQLQIHKGIENDLVKRSSLAQSLIKQLNKRVQQIQGKQDNNDGISNVIAKTNTPGSSSRITNQQSIELKQLKDQIIRLKLQLAKQQNYGLYLQNRQQQQNQKYQTLGQILANYLQTLLMKRQKSKQQQLEGIHNQIVLDMGTLRKKDLKQWKLQQLQVIVTLLLMQIKPYIKSLTYFPDVRNVNISFVEQAPKQAIALPKIVQEYQKSYEKQTKKGRFKDIPIDISTKILRSNLRDWGRKVNLKNQPINQNKYKSKSIAPQLDRSLI